MPRSKKDIIPQLESAFKQEDKVAVFIDGYSASQAARAINLKIDWKKFAGLFKYLSRVVSMNFYITQINGVDDFKALAEWLAFNGFKVTTANGHRYEYIDANSSIVKSYKNGYDNELIIDALTVADRVDKIVIFSSNPDLCNLVLALQRKGVSVVVITNSAARLKEIEENSSKRVAEAASTLIRNCNEFYELLDLVDEVETEEAKA